MFIRKKTFQKNGRDYSYYVLQSSVRVGGKVKSIYYGRFDGEPTGGAMLLNEANMIANQEALADGRYTTMADPGGKEKAPTEVEAFATPTAAETNATPAEAAPPSDQSTAGETSPSSSPSEGE